LWDREKTGWVPALIPRLIFADNEYYYSKSLFKWWIFGFCEPSVRLSLQRRIAVFAAPRFQILNRLE
jgi:hypothetical protein